MNHQQPSFSNSSAREEIASKQAVTSMANTRRRNPSCLRSPNGMCWVIATALWIGWAGSASGQTVSKAWEHRVTGAYFSVALNSLSIAPDGTIYAGGEVSSDLRTRAGLLLALNPDGTRKWEFKTPTPILTSPAVGRDGIVYFLTDTYLTNNKGFTKLFQPVNSIGTAGF